MVSLQAITNKLMKQKIKKAFLITICVTLFVALLFSLVCVAALCVRGTIIRVSPASESELENRILIEIKQPSIVLFEPSLDRIWLCMNELPPYEVGDEIFAWLGFSGGVADSYPPQTSANRIWRIKSAEATD